MGTGRQLSVAVPAKKNFAENNSLSQNQKFSNFTQVLPCLTISKLLSIFQGLTFFH